MGGSRSWAATTDGSVDAGTRSWNDDASDTAGPSGPSGPSPSSRGSRPHALTAPSRLCAAPTAQGALEVPVDEAGVVRGGEPAEWADLEALWASYAVAERLDDVARGNEPEHVPFTPPTGAPRRPRVLLLPR